MTSNSTWYSDGLRWIASLFDGAADSLDRAAAAPEPRAEFLPYEEFISDVRHRIQNRYY